MSNAIHCLIPCLSVVLEVEAAGGADVAEGEQDLGTTRDDRATTWAEEAAEVAEVEVVVTSITHLKESSPYSVYACIMREMVTVGLLTDAGEISFSSFFLLFYIANI